MTNMAAMPIYGKNLKNSSSLEPKLEYYQVCSNDDLGLTLTYFIAMSNLVHYAFVWEKGKTMDFSETIVVCDIKVGRCSQLNEYMNLYEYQRSRSFIDLCPRSLRFNIFKLLLLRNPYGSWSQMSCGASMGWGNESEYNWFMSYDQDGHYVHIW